MRYAVVFQHLQESGLPVTPGNALQCARLVAAIIERGGCPVGMLGEAGKCQAQSLCACADIIEALDLDGFDAYEFQPGMVS